MDYRAMVLLCLIFLLSTCVLSTEGRNKKVVIHVPYKVKKIKHTHTVFRTVHHHHIEHSSPPEDCERFHNLHTHDEPTAGHSQPIPGVGIPEFLPDVPLDNTLNIPDVPIHEIPGVPSRYGVPLYRRKKLGL